MPCFQPKQVWWAEKPTANGNKGITFTAGLSDGQPSFNIPCGQCTGCRIAHSSGWTTRLYQEAKRYIQSSFLTLTYSPEHEPATGSLCKRDLQLFMKRVRKHFPGVDMRYFAVGEYGDISGRAHYHMILFGMAFVEDRRPHSKNSAGQQLFKSELLDKLWGKGHCLIGNVSAQSCGYVAQYAHKKVNGTQSDEAYRRVDPQTGETWLLQKEFALMSRRPAIGFRYFQENHRSVYLRGSVIMNGRQVPIPKYFDRKLAEIDPLLMESIKTGRFEDAQERLPEQTPERLVVREECAKAKRQAFTQRTL